MDCLNHKIDMVKKHPMCKISSKDVEEIRKMIKSKKYTQHQIALNYGVSDTTISEIKTNKKRKNRLNQL